MGAPKDLDIASFDSEVTGGDGIVLVDFWSQTCPHCQRFNPSFAEAAESGRTGVTFAKVCAQEAMDLFREHEVHSVPTLVLFRNGAEIAREPGAKTTEEVLAWLDAHL